MILNKTLKIFMDKFSRNQSGSYPRNLPIRVKMFKQNLNTFIANFQKVRALMVRGQHEFSANVFNLEDRTIYIAKIDKFNPHLISC